MLMIALKDEAIWMSFGVHLRANQRYKQYHYGIRSAKMITYWGQFCAREDMLSAYGIGVLFITFQIYWI